MGTTAQLTSAVI